MFESIAGHKKQLELLGRAYSKGTLAHAYVFAGPERVGKKMIARSLAWELLERGKKGEMGNRFHPDLLEIDGTEGIKIEQIRELIYKLSLKPYQAPNKVAVIDNAHELTDEAANALLKTLEEPKDFNYIFLITSNPQRLPKTILSRCQKITFGPLSEDRKIRKSDESDQAEEFLQIFQNSPLEEKLVAAYDMAEMETMEIKKMLEDWAFKLESELLKKPSKNLAQKISQVLLSRKYLDQNANSKLLLTNLMLQS